MTQKMLSAATVLAVLFLPGVSAAQVFGTFTWQMQPYCNRVTLTLTSTPAGFTLDGSDDACGGNTGGASGMAVFTPAGTVAVNFTVVTTPAARGVHVSGVVNPGTGSGTWTDSVGNSGTFALAGATPGLPARPIPTSGVAPLSITSAEVDPSQVQLRVTGACPAGQLMTGINANGTVVCSAPLSQQLSCVETVSPGTTIAAGAFGTQQTSACAAGYTLTGGSCSMSNFDGRVVTSRTIVSSSGLVQSHFCAFRNEGAGSVDGVAYARCCRVQ